VLLLVSGSFAQQNPNLRVQSNVVLVPTLVRDAEGHIVYGLMQDDFAISDDRVEQSVHLDDGTIRRAAFLRVFAGQSHPRCVLNSDATSLDL
jgi:hypothetical protein